VEAGEPKRRGQGPQLPDVQRPDRLVDVKHTGEVAYL
jgi:hypothetical protein